jgi:hypothetical protein
MWERLRGPNPWLTVVRSAHDEARRRGDRRVGTEHLMLGLLGASELGMDRLLGVDLDRARGALQGLDRAALAAIGIQVGGLPPPVPTPEPPIAPLVGGRMPMALTSGAGAVLNQAMRGSNRGERAEGPGQLLLALLACPRPDPVAGLIEALEIDVDAVRARLEGGAG